MAPPPPTSAQQPMQQRLLQLAQTLQFAWFCGHLMLIFCTLRYGLSYITFNYYSRWAILSYRTAFVAAAATYGIVVFKGYRARARSGKGQGSPLALAGDENVQYLAMALTWLFSRQTPLAILPFLVYSVFHVATYTRSILLPVIQPQPTAGPNQKPQASALGDSIGRFVKEYYDTSMTLVAILEIVLWFRLLGSAILFQKGAWILMIIYTAFLRARLAQSTFVQQAVAQMGARGDALVNRQDMPPAVRQGWEVTKGGLKQAHDATNVSKYVKGPQGQPPVQKKAQ